MTVPYNTKRLGVSFVASQEIVGKLEDAVTLEFYADGEAIARFPALRSFRNDKANKNIDGIIYNLDFKLDLIELKS